MKVEQMQGQHGQAICNQFILTDGKYRIFQSYQTIIARVNNKTGKIELDKDSWDYSRTTGKYRNLFLRETKKETEAKIKNGEYKLSKLN